MENKQTHKKTANITEGSVKPRKTPSSQKMGTDVPQREIPEYERVWVENMVRYSRLGLNFDK